MTRFPRSPSRASFVPLGLFALTPIDVIRFSSIPSGAGPARLFPLGFGGVDAGFDQRLLASLVDLSLMTTAVALATIWLLWFHFDLRRAKRLAGADDLTIGGFSPARQKPGDSTLAWIDRFDKVGATQAARSVEPAELAELAPAALAQALRETAAAVNGSLNIVQVLDRILENVARLLEYDAANITLVESGFARVVCSRGYVERGVEPWLAKRQLVVADIPQMLESLETGRPYLVSKSRDHPELNWVRSGLCVPMRVKDRTIGWLNFESATLEFKLDQAQPLALFADLAAIALENARLRTETERRAAQFSALHETAGELSIQHDLPAMLETIVNRAVSILGAQAAIVYFYDAARGELEVKFKKNIELPTDRRVQLGEGIAGRVAQTRQAVIADDAHTFDPLPPDDARIPFPAIVQVPMLFAGELIGVLAVSDLPGRKFTEEDVRLLAMFAEHAASAVHDTRLFGETRVRAEQFGLLYDAGLTLNSVLDLRLQLEFLFKIAMKALNGERVEYYRYDDSLKQLRFEMNVGRGDEKAIAGASRLRFSIKEDRGLVGWIARQRLPFRSGDLQADPRWISVDPNVRSGLWVVIEHEHELRGVLGVFSTRPNAFSAQDERLLVLFANQAATAMENARLFDETRRRADRLDVLNRIARAVNQTLKLDELVQVIYREINAILTVQTFFIALYDQAREELDFRIQIDEGVPVLPARFPLKTGLSSQVIKTKKSLLIRHRDKERKIPPGPETLWGSKKPAVSWLGVPMLVGEQVIGLISVQAYAPDVYGEEDERLLSTIADQVAVAVQKARLFDETQQRLVELEAVARISTALREARTADEMYPLLLDEILSAIGTEAGQIAFYDAASDNLCVAAARGWLRATPRAAKVDDSIAGRVFKSGKQYVTREFKIDPQASEMARAQMPAGWGGAVVPIRTAQEIIGVIDVSVRLPRELTPGETRLLNTLAEIAGNAVHHRIKLHEQTEQRLQRLDALHVIDTAIGASLDLRLTLSVLLDQVIAQLRVDAADVLLLDPYTQTLVFAAGRGFRANGSERTRVRMGQSYAGRAGLDRRPVYIPNLMEADAATQFPDLDADERFMAYYATPLIAKGQVKGILELFHRTRLTTDVEWMDFVETLAGQAAIVLDNAALFDSLQRSNLDIALAYDATIEGWARALDLHDPVAGGHAQETAELTLRLAQALGMSGAEMAHLRRGALLHDIGKMGIPDAVLLKRDRLSPEEEEIMHQHPRLAFELLSPIDYLRPAIDIPYCHHEKWDGTGYPRRLRGDQIPMAARLFAVADAWMELRSHKPGAAVLTDEQARQQIRAHAGTHLDPRIVDLFLRLLQESAA